MKTAVFSSHKFERPFLEQANGEKHELLFIDARLTKETSVFANGCTAVSLFVSDDASEKVLTYLHGAGIRFIVLRSAGFNNVDIKKAKELGMRVARVPAYSPYAVAEHTVALMLGLNRKLVRAHHRITEGNFSLEGLTGFDMNGKVAGILVCAFYKLICIVKVCDLHICSIPQEFLATRINKTPTVCTWLAKIVTSDREVTH